MTVDPDAAEPASIARWRRARRAAADADDALLRMRIEAGEVPRVWWGLRYGLPAVTVLAVAGAGTAIYWADGSRDYSDADFVSAARSRVTQLLTTDPGRPDQARRILDGATGDFYDAFAQSADAYSKYVAAEGVRGSGTVDGAAVQTRSGDTAAVLVIASLRVVRGTETTSSTTVPAPATVPGSGASVSETPRPSKDGRAGGVADSSSIDTGSRQVRISAVITADDGQLKLAGVKLLP